MPELRLQLDVMERNAARMANAIRALGKYWRPHVKSHSHPEIAAILKRHGACGATCATIGEVEAMADAEMASALLAHMVVNESDLNRLASLTQKISLLLTIDHFVHAERISETAQREGVEFRVLVDVNIGMNRTGVRPRVDAVRLAAAAHKLPGVSVCGIMGYEGHLLRIPDEAEKQKSIFESMNALEQTRDAFHQQDVPCDIVSAGGSGSFWITGQHPAVTELQAGGGIFGDPFYTEQCGLTDVESALIMKADVVSRPALDRAVLNVGRKEINPVLQEPRILNLPDAVIASMSAEHTVLNVDGESRDLRIGDTVELAVGYADHSLLMHRRIQVYDGSAHVDTWSVVRE